MSSYAIPARVVRAKRAKIKRGRHEYMIVSTGGSTEYVAPNGRIYKGIALWLALPKPCKTTLNDDAASVDVRLVSVCPWFSWAPWRLKFIADDYYEGVRFVEAVQANRATA